MMIFNFSLNQSGLYITRDAELHTQVSAQDLSLDVFRRMAHMTQSIRLIRQQRLQFQLRRRRWGLCEMQCDLQTIKLCFFERFLESCNVTSIRVAAKVNTHDASGLVFDSQINNTHSLFLCVSTVNGQNEVNWHLIPPREIFNAW